MHPPTSDIAPLSESCPLIDHAIVARMTTLAALRVGVGSGVAEGPPDESGNSSSSQPSNSRNDGEIPDSSGGPSAPPLTPGGATGPVRGEPVSENGSTLKTGYLNHSAHLAPYTCYRSQIPFFYLEQQQNVFRRDESMNYPWSIETSTRRLS